MSWEGWKSPTGNVNPGSWSNPANAYNDTEADSAQVSIPATSWSGYLELTHAALVCNALRVFAEYNAANINTIDVDVYYEGAWHDLYEGAFTDKTWNNYALQATYTVTAARVRFYNTSGGAVTAKFYEFDFYLTTAASAADPLSQVLNALWELLEAQPEVTALVATHNRIKLSSATVVSQPQKLKHSTGDLPELMIVPAGGSCNPHASSQSAQLVQRYGVGIVDGDLRVHKSFFPLKWAIFKALASIDGNLGLSFVRRIVVEDIEDLPSDAKAPGWSAAFSIVVELWYKRSDLKA